MWYLTGLNSIRFISFSLSRIITNPNDNPQIDSYGFHEVLHKNKLSYPYEKPTVDELNKDMCFSREDSWWTLNQGYTDKADI